MPSKPKAPHHRGKHQATARRITDAANNNPATRCWRCGRTLNEHPPHKTGRPAFWTAGHDDHNPTIYRGPEASTCNFTAGATLGNQRRTRPQSPHLTTTRPW